MFGHDCEAMQCEAALIAVAENGFEKKVGVGCAREEGAALRGHGCDGVGRRHDGIGIQSIMEDRVSLGRFAGSAG